MPLSKGDRLGPYEILALVGRVAWEKSIARAHDDPLHRDVAIKVSNARFTEFFTREPRAIAALDHGNVCNLYDVGKNYPVMEHVEGQDLRGPLNFEALRSFSSNSSMASTGPHCAAWFQARQH